MIERNGSSGFNCSQLNPDEERGSPGFDKTSRRLEAAEIKWKEKEITQRKEEKLLTGLGRAAAGRRRRGHLKDQEMVRGKQESKCIRGARGSRIVVGISEGKPERVQGESFEIEGFSILKVKT